MASFSKVKKDNTFVKKYYPGEDCQIKAWAGDLSSLSRTRNVLYKNGLVPMILHSEVYIFHHQII